MTSETPAESLTAARAKLRQGVPDAMKTIVDIVRSKSQGKAPEQIEADLHRTLAKTNNSETELQHVLGISVSEIAAQIADGSLDLNALPTSAATYKP